MKTLFRTDPDVARAVRDETRRQGSQLELIASENFVSEAVLEAMGTPLTNKYAEGLPGKRYYGGRRFGRETLRHANDSVQKLLHHPDRDAPAHPAVLRERPMNPAVR